MERQRNRLQIKEQENFSDEELSEMDSSNLQDIEFKSNDYKDAQLLGGFNAAPWSTTDEEKDYQDMICLGRKGGQSLKGEGTRAFFSRGFY